MKSLFWLIILATAATLTALGAWGNGGYVLLVLPPWRVELSLNFLPILLAVTFLAFYGLLRAYSLLRQLPAQARSYQQHRQLLQAHQTLFLANRLLFEGRVGQALKKATEAYLAGAPKGLTSLIAARAAQRMRNRHLVEPWVERAIQDDPESLAAALMLQAETQIDQHRFEEALQTLEKLQKNAGRHFAALRLELRARQGIGDWENALRLARQLEKREAISAQHAHTIQLKAHQEIVREWGKDAASLLRYLRKVPEAEKSPLLVKIAAQTLSQMDAGTEAEKLLESLLDEQPDGPWHQELVTLYGKLPGKDLTRRIARAEDWLVRQPRDAGLLYSLGFLCQQQRLWGKAQSYFEAALSIAETPEIHLALAQLFEQIERSPLATAHYRAAALLGQSN